MPTYAEYQAAGGKLNEADYARFIRRAWAYLDTLTLGKIKTAIPNSTAEKVKAACFDLAELFYQQEQGGEVVSASNDGYSETYAASGKTPEQRLYSAAALYLGCTGLLYRGVDK